MNWFQRIFGSGPLGALISLLLLVASAWLASRFDHLQITAHINLRFAVFATLSLVTLLIVIWSLKSLPIADRGKTLTTTGAFRYFRHPLYGAFLSFFNFGLAVFLNNWIFILWAVVQHPVWHWMIRGEEKLMEEAFPGEYREYAARTGRFFPRI